MTLTMTRKVSECQAETVQFMPIEKVRAFCQFVNLLIEKHYR